MQKWWTEIQWHWTVTEGAKVISCLYATWWVWSPPSGRIIIKYIYVFLNLGNQTSGFNIQFLAVMLKLKLWCRPHVRIAYASFLKVIYGDRYFSFDFVDASRKPGKIRLPTQNTAEILSDLKIKWNVKLSI